MIVADGFVGNVAIKTSEGLVQMVSGMMREEFERSWAGRIAGILSLPVVRSHKNRVDHRRYNGATLVGLQGTVIKSHGNADALAFEHAIDVALADVRNNVPEHMSKEVRTLLGPMD